MHIGSMSSTTNKIRSTIYETFTGLTIELSDNCCIDFLVEAFGVVNKFDKTMPQTNGSLLMKNHLSICYWLIVMYRRIKIRIHNNLLAYMSWAYSLMSLLPCIISKLPIKNTYISKFYLNTICITFKISFTNWLISNSHSFFKSSLIVYFTFCI